MIISIYLYTYICIYVQLYVWARCSTARICFCKTANPLTTTVGNHSLFSCIAASHSFECEMRSQPMEADEDSDGEPTNGGRSSLSEEEPTIRGGNLVSKILKHRLSRFILTCSSHNWKESKRRGDSNDSTRKLCRSMWITTKKANESTRTKM